MQLVCNIFYFLSTKWSTICIFALNASHFTSQTFYQMSNRHSRWYSMWVNDNIWCDSFFSEWHIFLSISHSYGSFLTMSTCKLISYLRYSDRPHSDFSELIPFYIVSQHHLIYNSIFTSSKRHGTVLMCFLAQIHFLIRIQFSYFANNDIITSDSAAHFDESIIIQLIISTFPHLHSVPYDRWTKLLLLLTVLFFLIMICPEKYASKKTTVNSRLVHYDRVFLIISSETSNSHNTIYPTR